MTTTVLIVEDEPLQRMNLTDLVECAGYEAIVAEGADRAIEILESRTDIRIVLADINMPGSMDGLRLAAMVRRRWPPIEIIMMTAGAAPALEAIPARAVYMPKPLSGHRVRAALSQFAA